MIKGLPNPFVPPVPPSSDAARKELFAEAKEGKGKRTPGPATPKAPVKTLEVPAGWREPSPKRSRRGEDDTESDR